MSQVRGVALIIVLILTVILGLLIAQLSLTARSQIDRARALTELTTQRLELHSAETELLFRLLTSSWERARDSDLEASTLEQLWSFDGVPFGQGRVIFKVQDLSGRLPLPQPADSPLILERALTELGLTATDARKKALKLTQFYSRVGIADKLAPAPIQSMSELVSALELSPPVATKLEKVFTLYPVTQFNINSASDTAIRVRYPRALSEALISARDQGVLDAAFVYRLTGTSFDEFSVFFPGPAFEISTHIDHGDSLSETEAIWLIQPYELEALRLWGRGRSKSLESFE